MFHDVPFSCHRKQPHTCKLSPSTKCLVQAGKRRGVRSACCGVACGPNFPRLPSQGKFARDPQLLRFHTFLFPERAPLCLRVRQSNLLGNPSKAVFPGAFGPSLRQVGPQLMGFAQAPANCAVILDRSICLV